ncbi:MAG: SgcJ/EcaC family oxidoreductase [Thermoanaerobaculia bacterium]
MNTDEREIRELISSWMEATKAGDVDTVLSLIAEDAVFLLPGQPVMRKVDFEVAARAQSATDPPLIDGRSEIQEIRIFGEWAFMWTKLAVAVTPHGGKPARRAGHTLTVLKKENGRWVLARDANMLVPVDS